MKNNYDKLIYSGDYRVAYVKDDSLELERVKSSNENIKNIKILKDDTVELSMAAFEVKQRDIVIDPPESELNKLNSESVALQMEYESRVSYANLEQSAASLGMKKLDKDQVVYIKVNDKVKAINSNGETMVANN